MLVLIFVQIFFNHSLFPAFSAQVVAKPHSPDNRDLARNCRDVKITRAYIGSCTGGKTEDFIAAARILQYQKVRVPTFLVPATTTVYSDLHKYKINGQTLAEIFYNAGCIDPASPSCAACLGGPKVFKTHNANSHDVLRKCLRRPPPTVPILNYVRRHLTGHICKD